MSWFVVFASTVLPIALLFIMLAMDWLQRGFEATPSLLRVRSCEGTDKGDGTKRSMRAGEAVTKGPRHLISAGMIALAITAGQDLNALASGPQVTSVLKAGVAGSGGPEWNVVTVELAPGVVDARHADPGAELIYVLEGAGMLEADGRAPVALNPGVVAALHPKQSHIFKNTSQTQKLKVLVVLLLEKGHQRPLFANGSAASHHSVRKQVANASPRQQKADERKDSGRHELTF